MGRRPLPRCPLSAVSSSPKAQTTVTWAFWLMRDFAVVENRMWSQTGPANSCATADIPCDGKDGIPLAIYQANVRAEEATVLRSRSATTLEENCLMTLRRGP